MDLKLLEQKQFVERYLLGRLSPPEAKFFEQVVRRSPQLAERMGLPEALKRTMKLLDETGTEWREEAPKFWHDVRVPIALAAAFLLTLVLAITFLVGKHEWQDRYAELRTVVATGSLDAPTRTAVKRLRLGRPGEARPDYNFGSRVGPTLAELRIDTAFAKGNLYMATIRRDDGTYWARIDNLLRDSNGQLRIAINTGAFAAGTYDLDVSAVNLRGEGVPAGRLRFHIDPG